LLLRSVPQTFMDSTTTVTRGRGVFVRFSYATSLILKGKPEVEIQN
jgi:hypothetical protein